MKRVYVELKVKLVLDIEDDIDTDEVLDELDYSFDSTIEGAEVYDSNIEDSFILREYTISRIG